MHMRLWAVLVAVGAVVAISSCDDPTGLGTALENIEARPTVFALNGTPATAPAAILARNPSSGVLVNGSLNFDVAFDLNASGEVVAYTTRAIASQFAPGHRVGLLATDKSFDAATTAPTSGYAYDSSMVVPIGQTIFIDAVEGSCFSILGQNVRAKFVVDSVHAPSRTIYLHALGNPNCGFRSLAPGTPKE
jgi:hypothetical protein